MRKQIATAFILTSLLLGSLTSVAKAQAGLSNHEYRARMARIAAEAQRDMWNSFTPRQKQLSQLVSNVAFQYWQGYGQPIPMDAQTLNMVMRGIGAQPHEADFVWSRMYANHNAIVVMAQANGTISRTQRFVECLERGGTMCMP